MEHFDLIIFERIHFEFLETKILLSWRKRLKILRCSPFLYMWHKNFLDFLKLFKSFILKIRLNISAQYIVLFTIKFRVIWRALLGIFGFLPLQSLCLQHSFYWFYSLLLKLNHSIELTQRRMNLWIWQLYKRILYVSTLFC